MDETARGIAIASLTLQSAMLQALVAKGILTADEATEVVDKSRDSVIRRPEDIDADHIAEVAFQCLADVREGLKPDLPRP